MKNGHNCQQVTELLKTIRKGLKQNISANMI